MASIIDIAAALTGSPAGFAAAVTMGIAATSSIGLGASLLVPRWRRRAFAGLDRESFGDLLGWPETEDLGQGLCAFVSEVRGTRALTLWLNMEGRDSGGLSDDDLVTLRRMRRDCLSHLGDLDVHLRFWHHRQRQSVEPAPSTGGNAVVKTIVDAHETRLTATASRTVHLAAITATGAGAGERLLKAAGVVRRYLKWYQPRPLDPRAAESTGENELLTLLADLTNKAARRPVAPRARRLGVQVAAGGIELVERVGDRKTPGLLRCHYGDRECYAYVVGISDWQDSASEALLADIMTLPGEWTVHHQVRVLDAIGSERLLDHLGRNPLTQRGEGAAQFRDMRLRLQPQSAERERLCHYDQFIIVYGDHPAAAADLRDRVVETLIRHRVTPQQEGDNLAGYVWWSQWPGYEGACFLRESRLSTLDVAALLGFESQAEGLSRCSWGKGWALTFPGLSGGSYRLCLHETSAKAALAHTVVFGPTGQGKTTLISAILYGIRAHFPNVAAFVGDRKLGQLVAAVAGGATYVGLLSSTPGLPQVSLNPIARRPMDQALLAHLRRLFVLMTGQDDTGAEDAYGYMTRTAAQLEVAGRPIIERSLATIAEASLQRDSKVWQALKPYLPGGTYELVMGQGEETVPIDEHDFVAFDFTSVLDDPAVAVPVVADTTWLIQRRVKRRGGGAVIVLDESKALFANREFADKAANWHEELRKDEVAVVTMWQRPSQIREVSPSLENVLQTQTATWIFLRDPNAKAEQYGAWLTPEELAVVQGNDPRLAGRPYAFLLKKPRTGESVILDGDLSHLGPALNLFRSDDGATRRVRELMRRHGAEQWVPIWLDEAGRSV